MLLDGQLYKKIGNGVLAKCISEHLGMEILNQVHDKICHLEGLALARRIERLGYFWPTLRKKATEVQKNCKQCQLSVDIKENCFVEK